MLSSWQMKFGWKSSGNAVLSWWGVRGYVQADSAPRAERGRIFPDSSIFPKQSLGKQSGYRQQEGLEHKQDTFTGAGCNVVACQQRS